MSFDEFTPVFYLIEFREQHKVLAASEAEAFAAVERGLSEVVQTEQEVLSPKS